MTDRIVLASDALAAGRASLVPALEGCPLCGSVRQIAAPMLTVCMPCDARYEVLPARTLPRAHTSA